MSFAKENEEMVSRKKGSPKIPKRGEGRGGWGKFQD
jgi:hypothetical protein